MLAGQGIPRPVEPDGIALPTGGRICLLAWESRNDNLKEEVRRHTGPLEDADAAAE